MSISLNANFELLSAGLYLDARQQFNTLIEMKDFAETSIPDGFITYNKETQKHYVFSSSNTVDATLGKWREYNSGDSSSTTYATWNSNVDYKVGNVVLKDEVRYSCIADHTSTDFETDINNWIVILEQYYHVTQEQYNKMVSDGLITDSTKDLYIIDGNSEEIPLGEQVYSNTPIGTVLSFAGQIAPNGYLLCDGATYAVADYQDLYDAIGNTYGGDTENFNVPNLIDRFIQGSNVSGTEKEAGLPQVNMTNARTVSGQHATIYAKQGLLQNGQSGYGASGSTSSLNATSMVGLNLQNNDVIGTTVEDTLIANNPIYGNSDTVQPPALTMVYIIKAFHTNEGVDETVELTDTVINHITNKVAEIERESELFQYENRVITLETQVNELFQSVSDGKTLVANAITGKGVPTSSTDTFATMASNIRNLNNGIGYTSESKNGSVRVERGGTASISITFSNTVLGVTGVSYSWSDAHLGYRGFSVSGNTVTVKIELSDTYANSSRTISCTVSANIRT